MQAHNDIQQELDAWRNNVITKILRVAALVFTPVLAIWFIKFTPEGIAWQATSFYLLVYLIIIILAIFPKIDTRIKAWGLILVSYLTGTVALMLGGLVGDGRIYYLTAPILALLLISVNAGIAVAAFCLLTYFGISLTAQTSWFENWLLINDNSLALSIWVQEGVVVAACLILILALQKRHSELLTSLATEKAELFNVAHESEKRYRLVSDCFASGENGIFGNKNKTLS
ncbi:MAG: hypothetical protein HN855_10810 [Anaerolineae bacterium]|jgi:hypothetical protein|nr:hypothetical protein [Anaerolineae bacterium]MBT7069931.1 hypothetical protein [Anaerolineae bacterium]MBT7325642.1 hypothetical protein [Anaerolineae bacterium]